MLFVEISYTLLFMAFDDYDDDEIAGLEAIERDATPVLQYDGPEEHPKFDASISPDLRENHGRMQYVDNPKSNEYGVTWVCEEYWWDGTRSSTEWRLFECRCNKVFWKREVKPSEARNCGCWVGPNKPDLLGQKFSKLLVKAYRKGIGWLCVCECGKERWATAAQLKTGLIRHCGQCRNKRPIKESAQLSAKMLQDARKIKLLVGDSMVTIIERLFYAGLPTIEEYQNAVDQISIDNESIEE